MEAQKSDNFAALAWGNGSSQGYYCGNIEGSQAKRRKKGVLYMEVGLREVQTKIIKLVHTNFINETGVRLNGSPPPLPPHSPHRHHLSQRPVRRIAGDERVVEVVEDLDSRRQQSRSDAT